MEALRKCINCSPTGANINTALSLFSHLELVNNLPTLMKGIAPHGEIVSQVSVN